MFNRFTANAKGALNEAWRLARRLNHEYLGTEHILLGVLEKDGCRARAMLESLRISPDRLRSEIDKLIQPGPPFETMGQLPFTSRAKKVLEYTMEESDSLGSRVIGTEHLLIGLAREPDGVASKALSACGLSVENARALLRDQAEPEAAAGRTGRSLTGSGDHRSEAWRLRVLEDAVDALIDLQEPELAAKLREVARKYGSRKSER